MWSDLDSDGQLDAGESGLQGVTVTLVGAGPDGSFGTGDDLSFPNQSTNGSGGYAFTGLQAGIYRVDVAWAGAPRAFALTTGNDPLQLTLGAGQSYQTADFGFVYRGEIALSVDPGVVTTVAGNGTNQTVDGTGSGASFRDMGGVTSVDGWVYVATRGSIRKVNPATGQVTTLAGHASSTGCTDSSTPTSVRFDSVSGLTSDGVYLYTLSSCSPDPKLRRIAIDTGATTTLTTVPGAAVGSFPGSSEVVFGPDGYLYATSGSNMTVVRVDPSSGAKTTFATLAGSTYGIAADRTYLWVLIDVSGTKRVERIALSDAYVTTFVSSTDLGTETIESAGPHLYVATSSHFSLRRYKKADASWTLVAGTNATGYADGTATDAWFAGVKALGAEGGALWVADDSNKRLRKAVDGDPLPASQPASANTTLNVDPGAVTTFAGSGTSGNADGVGTAATFEYMTGVVVVDGHAYVATKNYIRKVNLATGQVTRLAGNGGNGCGDNITATAVSFYYPSGVATDGRYIYSASSCPSGQASKVRRSALATGATSTIAAVVNVQGITFGPDGYLYATTGTDRKVVRVDRNTGATSTFATLSGDAYAITSDATHLWVAIDTGTTRRIEKITVSDATVTTFVSGTALSRWGLESAGNYLYASADHSFYGYSIRRYTKVDGNWAPVAGTNAGGYADGTATDAWFNAVQGIAADGVALWISDSSNNRLRKAIDADPLLASQPTSATSTLNVDPGAVTTFAGSGTIGNADGVGTEASFESMTDVVVVNGYAYVATKNYIRKVNLTTGQVTKLAGNGSNSCGDNGAGTSSSIYLPSGVATDGRYIYASSLCPSGQPSKVRRTSLATGATSTVATVANAQGVTFGPDGYIYITTGTTRTVVRVDRSTGATSTFATLTGDAYAITSDATHLWVAIDTGTTRRVEKVAISDGAVTTFVSGTDLSREDLESAGSYLYATAGANAQSGFSIRRYTKADGSWTAVAGTSGGGYMDGTATDAWFHTIRGIASDGTTLWISDSYNGRLRKAVDGNPLPAAQSPTATATLEVGYPAAVYTFAGNGLLGDDNNSYTEATFSALEGMVVVGAKAYVGSKGFVRNVDLATGETGSAGQGYWFWFNKYCGSSTTGGDFRNLFDITTDGHYLYTTGECNTNPNRVARTEVVTAATSTVAEVANAGDLTFGPDGYLYVTTGTTRTVVRVDRLTGATSTFATLAGDAYDITSDATHLYVAIQVSDTVRRIEKIAVSDGSVSTFVSDPAIGLHALESAGSYLYGAGNAGWTLRRYMKADGTFTDIAGLWSTPGFADGKGADVRFGQIRGIASDGNLLWIADGGNLLMRVAANKAMFAAGQSSFGWDGYGGWWGGVNAPLGNFVHSQTDVKVETVGPELEVTRTYNNLDPREAAFGMGWTFNYEMTWEPIGIGNVAVIYPDGRREIHKKNDDGSFSPPPGYYSTLAPDGGGYTLTTKERVVYRLDAQKRLTSITDPNGHRLDLTYDGGGKLERVTDARSGRTFTFTWTTGHITSLATDSVTYHGGPLVWKYYYTGDKLTKACDPRNNAETGSCTTYEYAGRYLNRVLKPKGNTDVSLGYLPSGKVDWRANGLGNLTDFQYPAAKKVTVVDARSNSTAQEYDGKFRLTKDTDPLGKITTYEYDTKGNRTKVTDPNLNFSQMAYDTRGNLTSSTDPEGKTTYREYDGQDSLTVLRDPRSSGPQDNTYATTFGYDSAGNRTRETSPVIPGFPQGIERTWTYTNGTEAAVGGGTMPPGLLRTEVDRRGKTTTFSYDSKGDLREVVDPVGLRTTYVYDELGRKTTEVVYSDAFPAGVQTTFAYDKLGNVTSSTGPPVTNAVPPSPVTHQQKVVNVYDENENLASSTVQDLGPDPPTGDLDRVTSYAYDAVDREITVTDPEVGVLSRDFDAVGNVIRVTDPEGRVTEIAYDARNLPTQVVAKNFVDDPVGGSPPRDVVLKEFTYDPAGRKLTETDARGRVRQWAYDKADRILSVTLKTFHNRDATTRDIVLEAYTYDAAGNVLTETTGGGIRRIVHTYDAASRKSSSTLDPTGLNRVATYTRDGEGNVTELSITGGGGTETVRLQFDDGGRLTARTVENGAIDFTTSFGYDQRGNLTAETDPRGNLQGADPEAFTTRYAYDELNRLARTTFPSVEVVEGEGSNPVSTPPIVDVGYDTFGNPTHRKDAKGFLTETVYDRLDRPTLIRHPQDVRPDDVTIQPTEAFAYDRVGNLTRVTDRRTQITDFTFDKLNRVVQQLDPLLSGQQARGQVRFEYDDAGNRTALVDQRGARTEWTYDDLDRARAEVQVVRRDGLDPLRLTTTLDYDDLGNLTYEENPAGEVTRREYSPASELTKFTDPLLKETTYAYDLASRMARETDPLLRKTEFTYDLAGRLTESRRYGPPPGNALLVTTGFGYDAAGNQTSVTSPRTFTTTSTYDALSRLTSVTEPITATQSMTTSYWYDAASNHTRTRDGELRVTNLIYSPWNLLEKIIEPSTTAHPAEADRTFTLIYDAGGLPVKEWQPGAVNITRDYDALGRLTTESGSGGGAPAATRTFGYDLAGLRTSVGHPDGTISLTYDDRGLLTGASGPAGTSSYTYDVAGRLTRRVDPAGTHDFTWTTRGELNTATDPLTGTLLDHDWDAAGQLDKITYGTGTGVPVRDFTFDDLGRLTADILRNGTGAEVTRLEYGYDDDGNVATQAITLPGNPSSGTHAYNYDRAGRLEEWTRPGGAVTTYTWDKAGNRTGAGASTYTYDQRNRLLSGPGASYSYTPRGTLSQVTQGGSTFTYSFDALGRLTDYNGQVAYTYDGLDRVARRAGVAFSYAGTAIDPASAGGFTYARDPQDRLLSLSNGTTSLLAGLNGHGDLTHLFTPAASVTDTRVWEPFGKVSGQTGTTNPAVGFQADYTDPASGRVWMGARWYGPEEASFISRDTVAGVLRTPISLNRYTYGFADPLEFIDPDGHCPQPTTLGQRQDCINATLESIDQDYPGGPPPYRVGMERLAVSSTAAQKLMKVVGIAQAIITDPHARLDLAGMLPGIGPLFDAWNARLYQREGDLKNAAISIASIAPFGGDLLNMGRVTRKVSTAAEVAKGLDRAADGVRGASRLRQPVEALAATTRRAEGMADLSKSVGRSDAIDFKFGLRASAALPGISRRPNLGAVDEVFETRLIRDASAVSLRSSNRLMGVERASPELIQAVSNRRSVVFATEGSEELRYLDYMGAEANVGGPGLTHILLRENPSKVAVLEEFLHGTQQRLGIIDRLGVQGAEWHVKDFMIRHRNMLGLGTEDVRILEQLRDMGL